MDTTRAVETLAKHQFTRLRENIIRDNNLSEDQVPAWDDIDVVTKLILKEEALDDIEKILPYVEQQVLSDLSKDERFNFEATALINDLALNKDLELLTDDL